jgi:hypothetical protein
VSGGTGHHTRALARKFDGSPARRGPRGPPIVEDVEDPIVRMTKEKPVLGL